MTMNPDRTVRRPVALPSAGIAYDASGCPVSSRFRDIYKNRSGALAEAHHVFVLGSRLPERLAEGGPLTIFEAGLGLAVNLFATWQAKRAAGHRGRLHYIAVEGYPVTHEDLRRAWAVWGLAGPFANALLARWPAALTRGRHRLVLTDEIHLTLVLDDIAPAVANLDAGLDAIYLDGFSPALNPEMWSSGMLRALARWSRPGTTTLATYSSSSAVKSALGDAGFKWQKRDGSGEKRHALTAVYSPAWRTRWQAPPVAAGRDTRIAVIGSGLAAAFSARALHGAGRSPAWFGTPLATGRSPSLQPALAAHPHLSPDDNVLSRLCRAALSAWDAVDADDPAFSLRLSPERSMRRSRVARLMLAHQSRDTERLRGLVDSAALPTAFAHWLEREEASAEAGVALASGGVLLPRVPTLVAVDAATDPGPTPVAERVTSLRQGAFGWQLLADDGRVLYEADAVVVATGDGGRDLLDWAPFCRAVRGQSTVVSGPELARMRAVIGSSAYACPLGHGRVLLGASYDERTDSAPDPGDDDGNLSRFARMLGGPLGEVRIHGATVGFRHVSPDRLPWIGGALAPAPLRDDPGPWRRNDRLALPRHAGVFVVGGFGSRGVLWSALAASLVVDRLDGAPTLLDSSLLSVVDPARFARRALRRGLSIDG
ncbi:MAG: FAD-dependent 5-carboxymethylaminomethyl-2-thiouridine(34) oxidoreductase MnmC [Burkholderiaceae bacterium]